MIHSKQSVTALFPAYNDETTIENIVCSAWEELAKFTRDFEILVVNDGSRDRTREILDRLQRELPYLRVIHHEKRLGYGAAMRTGFQNATRELIFYTDCDGQYDVREMHNLVAQLGPDIDMVSGYKMKGTDRWNRAMPAEIYRQTMRGVFNLSIRDVDCDFRLFRRSIFESIKLRSRSEAIGVEMAGKFDRAGFAMAEVPVSHCPKPRRSGELFRVRQWTQTFGELLLVWLELAFTRRLIRKKAVAAPATVCKPVGVSGDRVSLEDPASRMTGR